MRLSLFFPLLALLCPTLLSAQSLTSFSLMDADLNVVISQLNDGDTINLAQVPTQNLSIRANTSAGVNQVVFNLSGPQNHTQTENVQPYALFGDNNGNFNPWTPPLGTYSLTGDPNPGNAVTVSFTVVSGRLSGTPVAFGTPVPYTCGEPFKVLLYTETSGYDHQTRNATAAMLTSLGAQHNFSVTHDSTGAAFDQLASLEEYAVVLFANTSGDAILSPQQRSNFEAYIAGGGSLMGIHAASDTYRHSTANGGNKGTWDYYAALLGASVQTNPNHTSSTHNGTMDTIGAHWSTQGLPDPWNKIEEYYYWENGYYNPANRDVLRVRSTGNNSYDAARPMSWYRELPSGGRVFYTALGHGVHNYTVGTDFAKHILDALLWTADRQVVLCGELKRWHRVSLTFRGHDTWEEDTDNPFTEYRLLVTFQHGNKTYVVPGFYAADGNAKESSASSGNKWQVRFTPSDTGTWTWTASFRKGAMIAIDTMPGTGVATGFDGLTGTFQVDETDKRGRDNRFHGRLEYVGERYLRYAGSGKYFVKGGADAPENLMNFVDFDSTYNHGGTSYLKTWSPHVQDWQTGDPVWQGNKGKGLIGALNYLAGKGMNVYSFLTMNVIGDGKDVWPWTSHNERYRFDVSKLDQWEVVMEHADKLGMYLHFKTQETENDQLLDGGAVGQTRKLYYRELVARFGHHLALNWNLGEENTQTDQQRRDMALWFKAYDPYDHNIVIHSYPNQQNQVYSPLLGTNSYLTGASVQTNWDQVHDDTRNWVNASEQAGRPWVVANDEQGNANTGVTPEAGYPGMNGRGDNHDDIRMETLWGNLMAGGAGVEYYFGYQYPESDLTCQDWRSRDKMWDYTATALNFFNNEIPFWEMHNDNSLTSANDDYCFAKPYEVYAIYLPNGGTTMLDLDTSQAVYTVTWYDPRQPGLVIVGGGITVSGPGQVSIGNPPQDPQSDWVVLVESTWVAVGIDQGKLDYEDGGLRVFPNPGKDLIKVDVSRFPAPIEKVILVSSEGFYYEEEHQVFSVSSPDNKLISINTEKLRSGVYNLVVYSDRPDPVKGTMLMRSVKVVIQK